MLELHRNQPLTAFKVAIYRCNFHAFTLLPPGPQEWTFSSEILMHLYLAISERNVINARYASAAILIEVQKMVTFFVLGLSGRDLNVCTVCKYMYVTHVSDLLASFREHPQYQLAMCHVNFKIVLCMISLNTCLVQFF